MKKLVQYAGLAVFVMVMLLQLPAFVAQKQAQQKQKKDGAKALFYDPATGAMLKPSERQIDRKTGMVKVKPVQSNQAKYVGIHYWIELEGVGPVTADRTFSTGDRIRLHIRSNVDGYLSLWSLDSSGRGHLLFPPPDQGTTANFVKADTPYSLPGFIKFVPPAEEERLLVFFSRRKDDIPRPTGEALDADAGDKALGPEGAKALVFESEEKDPAEVGEYVVNKNGGPVARVIRLKHQPRDGGQ